jgi:hypothetical protein
MHQTRKRSATKMRLQALVAMGLAIAGISSCGSDAAQPRRTSVTKPGPQSGANPGRPPGTGDTLPDTSPHGTIPTPPVVAATPIPQASGGSGGPLGDSENNFTASNGKSSSYKISVPADARDKIYGLNIYLHGDGGGDYKWFYKSNAKIALTKGLIGVTVLAPNIGKQWYRNGEANALFVHELIQTELFKKYNLDKTKIYFAGTSGGSQFLTGQFIPIYGLHYNSGAVLMCGGPANWQDDLKGGDEFIKKFKLAWIATKFDFLLPQVEKGIAYYKSKGFQVESEILPTGNHCSFPGGLDAAMAKMISKVIP